MQRIRNMLLPLMVGAFLLFGQAASPQAVSVPTNKINAASDATRDILTALGATAPYTNTSLSGTSTGNQDSSTFTGWGTPVGIRQNFNRVKFILRPNNGASLPTFVRVRVRQTDSAGALLGEALVPVTAVVNTDLTVVADLGATIVNAGGAQIYLEFAANGPVGFHGISPATYPIGGTYATARYTTAGDLNTFPNTAAVSQRCLWAEFSLGEVLSRSEIGLPGGYPYASSTFSGHRVPIGPQPAFNRVQFYINPFDSSFVPTRLRVRVRQTSFTGTILAQKIVRVTPAFNVPYLVTVDFDAVIGNGVTLLCFEVAGDGRFGFRTVSTAPTTNPYPTPTYPVNQYATTGGIDATSWADAGSAYNMWMILQRVDTTRMRFEGVGAVQAAIRSIAGAQQAVTPFTPTATLSVPTHIYGVENREVNVYFDGIFRSWFPPSDFYWDVTCTKGKQEADRWTLVATSGDVGDTTWSLSLSFNNSVLVSSGNRTLRIAAANAGTGVTRKVLLIGDSTTAGGIWTGELVTLFGAGDPMDITLIGTQGSGSNKHEGYSGRSFNWFRTNASSPFVFSGAFNFSNYLTANSITMASNDWVLFHLGINDTFNFADDASLATQMTAMLADLNAMITNIKSAVAGIRIGVCITIPPARSQDAFGDDYGSGQTRARYLQNIGQWREFLLTNLSGQEAQSIYLLSTNCAIDTVWNFNSTSVNANARNTTQVPRQDNGVHPATSGYYQFADSVHAFLKYWQLVFVLPGMRLRVRPIRRKPSRTERN